MSRTRFKLHLHDLVRERGIHPSIGLEEALLAWQWMASTVKPEDIYPGQWGANSPAWQELNDKSGNSCGPAPILTREQLEQSFRNVFLQRPERLAPWKQREGIALDTVRWIQGPVLDHCPALRALLPQPHRDEQGHRLRRAPLQVHLNPVWSKAVEFERIELQLTLHGPRPQWTVTLYYGFNRSVWSEVLTESRPGEAPETWARRAVDQWAALTTKPEAAFIIRLHQDGGLCVYRDRQACTAGLPLDPDANAPSQHAADNGHGAHHTHRCRHERLAGPFETWAEAEDARIAINTALMEAPR